MGFKSGTTRVGAQGTLAHRRKEMQDQILNDSLELAQVNEVQRLAQEYSPAAMRELKRIATSHAKTAPVSDTARLTAIRMILEFGHGKPSAREIADPGVRSRGAGGRKVVINIRQYGTGLSRQLSTPAIEAKVLPADIVDAEIGDDL